MSTQQAFTQYVRVGSVAYRFRIPLVAGFCPLFGLVTHHLVVTHLLRVSSLDVLTGVIVSLFIIACVQLL